MMNLYINMYNYYGLDERPPAYSNLINDDLNPDLIMRAPQLISISKKH